MSNLQRFKVGVDTGRLLIIDPVNLDNISEDGLPEGEEDSALAEQVGPYGVGLLLNNTGFGDGTYAVFVETIIEEEWPGHPNERVSRVVIEFIPPNTYIPASKGSKGTGKEDR